MLSQINSTSPNFGALILVDKHDRVQNQKIHRNIEPSLTEDVKKYKWKNKKKELHAKEILDKMGVKYLEV